MGFDVNEMVKSKEALRRKLADRPIAEKLRLAEELSERALAIRPDDSPSPPDAPWRIPPHWRWKKMGEVATVVGGGTPPTDHDEYFGGLADRNASPYFLGEQFFVDVPSTACSVVAAEGRIIRASACQAAGQTGCGIRQVAVRVPD